MTKTDSTLVYGILDGLECAKAAIALFPQLPPNLKPVYFRILNAIYKIGKTTDFLRVSDISKVSGLLLPNTTRFINEMVELNILEKYTSDADKRVVLVRTTELGARYIEKFVLRFIEGLEREFSKIDEANCFVMIKTINEVYQAMRTICTE